MGEHGEIENSENFGNEKGISKDDLEKVLKSLLVDDYLSLEVIERKIIELTEEGHSYAKNGSPEFQFV
jgi:helix-turn-helix protein